MRQSAPSLEDRVLQGSGTRSRPPRVRIAECHDGWLLVSLLHWNQGAALEAQFLSGAVEGRFNNGEKAG